MVIFLSFSIFNAFVNGMRRVDIEDMEHFATHNKGMFLWNTAYCS